MSLVSVMLNVCVSCPRYLRPVGEIWIILSGCSAPMLKMYKEKD